MELLFLTTMKGLQVNNSEIPKRCSTTYVVGTVVLTIMVTNSIVITNFVVIDVSTHYNPILERPWIRKMSLSIKLLSSYQIPN